MLEEHIREVELQSQERLIDEQKRNKELLQRLEREKALELENYAIRLQSAERDQVNSTRDLAALRSQVDRLKTEKSQLEQELFETQQNYALLQKECGRLEDAAKRSQEQFDIERSENAHLVEELSKEVCYFLKSLENFDELSWVFFKKVDALRARLRSRSEEVISDAKVSSSGHDPGAAISRVKEMENELKSLQNENRKLKEDKDDLQAQVINGGVIAGRNVLQSTASMSIADELGSLSDQQVTNFATFCTLQFVFLFCTFVVLFPAAVAHHFVPGFSHHTHGRGVQGGKYCPFLGVWPFKCTINCGSGLKNLL